jgi:tripartite-type tricarboxylate transporter receptor subunit TctC
MSGSMPAQRLQIGATRKGREMKNGSALKMLVSVIALTVIAPRTSSAQDAASFFKGKTITINIGSSTGGGLDTYGRLVARHLGKHIPGNPTVIASNAPGAGGNIVALRLYSVAPKDGTQIGLTFPAVLIDPLLNESIRKDYDPTKFNYIGSAHAEVLVCFVRNDVAPKTPQDLLSQELIVGSTAPGSTTWDYPTVENHVLGTKLRVITGYKGSREVTLAVEKGEVQGICGVGWGTIKVQYPEVLSGKLFGRIFAQEDIKGHRELNSAGVPLMSDLVKTDDDRQILQMLYAQSEFSRPFILPPGVPAERVQVLRKAFDETMRDPDLLGEAQKLSLDVDSSSGEEVQAQVAKMYESPPNVIERMKKALGREK